MKKLSRAALISTVLSLVLPLSAFAEGSDSGTIQKGFGSLKDIITSFTNNVLVSTATLFLSLAVLAFFYGIVEYIWAKRKGDTKGVADGNKFMVAGLIALFVMFSVYGIIKLAQNTLFPGVDVETIKVPSINFGGGTPGGPATPAPGGTPTPAPGGAASPSTGGTPGGAAAPGTGGAPGGAALPATGGSDVPTDANGNQVFD
jgi:hypothetical protein